MAKKKETVSAIPVAIDLMREAAVILKAQAQSAACVYVGNELVKRADELEAHHDG